MHPIFLIGGVVGYIIACIIYGKLLPALSMPSIIGVLVGQAVLMFVGFLSTRELTEEEKQEEKQERQEKEEKKKIEDEHEAEKRYGSWSTDDLIAGVTINQQKHKPELLHLMKREIRRRKRKNG